MPHIYSNVYQPYTYDELIKPLQASTEAHQKIEDEYANNMLIVDSLRRRAENELLENPDSRWANDIINYSNQLEEYANDLSMNGLSNTTRMNLMNSKKGFGTRVSPVITAMAREKELQSIRDKADPKTRTLYGEMPSLDQIIENPNIGQSSYSGKDIYDMSKSQAASFAARNIEIIPPRNISEWMYEYGKRQGFTRNEINKALEDPALKDIFSSIKTQYGYNSDSTLSEKQKLQLDNEILLGALEGLVGTIDIKYGNRPDNPATLADLEGKRLSNQIAEIKLNGLSQGQSNSMYHTSHYLLDDKYQNLMKNKAVFDNMYDDDGNLKSEYKDRQIVDKNGNIISFKIEDIYRPLMYWIRDINLLRDPNALNKPLEAVKPKEFRNVEDEKLFDLWNQIQGYQSVKDVLNDFNLEGNLDNPIFQTRQGLYDYMNGLAYNKISTNIDFTKKNIISEALNNFMSKGSNKDALKDISYVEKGLIVGKKYSGNEIKNIKPENIGDVEYIISDPYYLYISLKGDSKLEGKTIKVPVSFFRDELGNEIRNILEKGISGKNGITIPSYQQAKRAAENDVNWSDVIDEETGKPMTKQQGLSRTQMTYQDIIAQYIQDYFKNWQEPVFGETEKRD